MSSEFWKDLLSWLEENKVVIQSFNEVGLFSVIFEKKKTEDFYIINHILLLRKCLGSLPSLKGFIARIKRVYNIELHIARERNKLSIHS